MESFKTIKYVFPGYSKVYAMNVKKNSKEEDFRNYSFMVQDIAGILTSLDLEAVIVEIYKYSGTQEEKADNPQGVLYAGRYWF